MVDAGKARAQDLTTESEDSAFAAPSDFTHGDSHEDIKSRKRARCCSIMEAHSDLTPAINHATGNNGPRRRSPSSEKGNNSDIDLSSEIGRDEQSRTSYTTSGLAACGMSKRQLIGQGKELPTVLSVPGEDGAGTLKSIFAPPHEVQNELRRRFYAMPSANQYRSQSYDRVSANPKHYLDRNMCVRDLCLNFSTKSLRGQMEDQADERCLKAREPCMQLILHNAIASLRMVSARRYTLRSDLERAWILIETMRKAVRGPISNTLCVERVERSSIYARNRTMEGQCPACVLLN
jgi:hypothetical protein